jgi:hypothetical protein
MFAPELVFRSEITSDLALTDRIDRSRVIAFDKGEWFRMRFVRISALILVALAIGSAALAQGLSPDALARKQEEFRNANNRWMLNPVDIRQQRDTVPPEQRKLRDAFWDSLIGASAPLDEPQTTHWNIFPGGNLTTAPEFPKIPGGVWLVGKFESYSTFLSASKRSIYTEIHIRVQHVFGNPTAEPTKGTTIDVARPGGTILAPWGDVASYWVDTPRVYDAQPGHVYLLLLKYHDAVGFYTEARRWDLTSGVATPDSELEEYRAKHGKSEINGRKLSDLIEYLDQKLANY